MESMKSENPIYEIKVKIHEEADLYNSLDPDASLLSDEVVSYIVRKYNEKPEPRDKHIIRIISDVPVNEDRVRKNIRSYIENEKKIVVKQQKKNKLKQIRLFAIGIAFIAIWLFLAAITQNIFIEVLSIIGSFAVWEAANIWIVESPALRFDMIRLTRLEETEVRFEVVKI